MDYSEAAEKFKEMTIEQVQKEIHPYVERSESDTDAQYFRRIIIWMMATMPNAEITGTP